MTGSSGLEAGWDVLSREHRVLRKFEGVKVTLPIAD